MWWVLTSVGVCFQAKYKINELQKLQINRLPHDSTGIADQLRNHRGKTSVLQNEQPLQLLPISSLSTTARNKFWIIHPANSSPELE